MLVATTVLAGLGLVSGLGLGWAARFFAVEIDPRQEALLDLLPGANCGGCGYAGCNDFAGAVVKGTAPADGCPVGGAATAQSVAAVMGLSVEIKERRVALIHCQGGDELAPRRFLYNGLASCASAAQLGGGDKLCLQGCLGLGDCQEACSFGAIEILASGIARIIPERCTACGKCVAACPKGIIELVPERARIHVLCSNIDKGPQARKACQVACIGCKKCEKAAAGGISVTDWLARVDYAQAPVDETLIDQCPNGSIRIVELGARQH